MVTLALGTGVIDLRGGPSETDVDKIQFQTTGDTTVIFDQTQFGAGFISNSVNIVGGISQNTIRVLVPGPSNFSAAGWVFTAWSSTGAISIEGTSASSNGLTGSVQADTIMGNGNSLDTITGGEGLDTLLGGGGGDNFRYFAGSELVAGEVAHGGAGSDAFSLFNTGAINFALAIIASIETLDFVSGDSTATFGDNQVGGTGVVTVSGSGGVDGFILTAVAQVADLSGVTFNGWTDGVDTITILGSGSNDTLTGSDKNDILDGGALVDLLQGGAGNDTYIVDISNEIIVEASGNGIDLVRSSASFVLASLQEIENLTLTGAATINGSGNGLANILTGNDAANRLSGFNGNDTMDGAGGNDTLDGGDGNDSMDGGAGLDIADYSSRFQTVEIVFNDFAVDTAKVGGVLEDTLKNVEGALGGSASDIFIGDGLANLFVGAGGNDTFSGGLGADTLDGGTGIDTVDYSRKQRIEVILNGATAAIVKIDGADEDSIVGIENVTAGFQDDKLSGDANANVFLGEGGNDLLKGGAGFDTLDGGVGSDTADFSDKTQKVKVVLNGFATVTAEVNGAFEDVLISIENVIGGSGGDKLTGDDNSNSFKGRGGKDVINGGDGSDFADYSDKNKIVEVALHGARIAAVKVKGKVEDKIKNIENVIGGSAGDKLLGDGNANTFKGMGGKDAINGGAGLDTADFSDKTKHVAVTLKGATAVTVKVGGANDDTIKNIESVIGGSAGDKLTGDDKANTFRGMGGADTINGGKGVDTADFSDKTESVQLSLNGGIAVNVKVDGLAEDSIKNIENIIGGSDNDTLTGDSKNNSFRGLGSADTIDGGGGSDTVDLSDHTERVAVTLNGAIAVRVSGFDDLISNIENVIGGSGNDVISGDSLANRLVGNDGDDELSGGEGKDTLAGGDGEDHLDGGASADRFLFDTALSAATNVDTIVGFTHNKDVIQLDDAIFRKIGSSLEGKEFFAAAGAVAAHDKDDRVIYDTTTGSLSYDADGKGGAAAIFFAMLSDKPQNLSAGDFDVV